MMDELVVSGIEKMHVQYGRHSSDGMNTQYFNANDIAGSSTGTDTPSWYEVSSVKLWLLARSSKEEPGYKNTSSYSIGKNAPYETNDGYRRLLFSTVIQLRNK